jgi:hypothetical protein
MTRLQARLAKVEARLAPPSPEVVQISIIASATGRLISRMRITSYGLGRIETICEGPFFENHRSEDESDSQTARPA